MEKNPAVEIVEQVSRLDLTGLEATLGKIGFTAGLDALQGLTFHIQGTGGGCTMLVADLLGTDGYYLGITDGEADAPTRADTFWVGVLGSNDEELYGSFVREGRVVATSGSK